MSTRRQQLNESLYYATRGEPCYARGYRATLGQAIGGLLVLIAALAFAAFLILTLVGVNVVALVGQAIAGI